MNWTASLLRNQLKKQKADYENRLNLLTKNNHMSQEKDTKIAELEAKIKELEEKLKKSRDGIISLQEILDEKYPTKEAKESVEKIEYDCVNIIKKDWYLELLKRGVTKIEVKKLDLSDFVNLKHLSIKPLTWIAESDSSKNYYINPFYDHFNHSIKNKVILGHKPALKDFIFFDYLLDELDLSDCPKLSLLSLTPGVLPNKVHPNYIEEVKNSSLQQWEKRYRKITKGAFYINRDIAQNIRELIDIADLDAIVNNYDWNKVWDLEYHRQLFGKNTHYFIMNFHALDNVSNRILARMLIIQSRLVVGKLDNYEKALHEYCEGQQLCAFMETGNYTIEQAQEIVNKALSGNKELLSRLQDLPYLHPDYKFTSPSYKFKDRE